MNYRSSVRRKNCKTKFCLVCVTAVHKLPLVQKVSFHTRTGAKVFGFPPSAFVRELVRQPLLPPPIPRPGVAIWNPDPDSLNPDDPGSPKKQHHIYTNFFPVMMGILL